MLEKNFMRLGGDPEIFILKDDKIVDSSILEGKDLDGYNKIVRDGYQGEIQVLPEECRETLASRYAQAIGRLYRSGLDFRLGHGEWIPEEEFASLDDSCKSFGCKPSLNIYGNKKVDVDAKFYMFRPLGGHIHLELPASIRNSKGKIKQLVRLLDIMVGSVCVAVDQNDNDNAVERRKNYGRAGEYRIKPYGLEYRTLSNFWLADNVLLSMVYGLARQAITIIEHSPKVTESILSAFGGEVEQCINSNDKTLSLANFERLATLLPDDCFWEEAKMIESDGPWEEDEWREYDEHFTLNVKTMDKMWSFLSGGFTPKKDYWRDFLETGSRGRGIESYLLEYYA